MKPWREVTIPHTDVLEGTFQQSEFAADITAVRTGKATREYSDAGLFFARTFITEGMRLLLSQVAQRLNGKGGEPVVQLQTAFGGGKTHTMLAVYHLAKRENGLSDLAGVSALVEQAGLMDVPRSNVAVIDGTAHAPAQPWTNSNQKIRTLWGELAWQLGGEDGYQLVKEADESGTSPGKESLSILLKKYAPCVVLMDELVAYIRNFQEGQVLSGGSFDSNLSFIQALTEASKLVPDAIVLASLPESEVEAGSQRGVAALRALEKTFGRVQALWKPVDTEEAFEIVRRRLFESVRDEKARDEVCRAFADMYIAEGVKLPNETQEARYFDRLVQAYPIHPEIFDRLYEDWTTIDGFQRTRGVLKLMAKVIYRLWKDDNKDLIIMPGSLPLYDGSSRNELLYHLPGGWDAVVEKDIDGERAETTELESKEPRFGSINAARRVGRTIFLGSAPSSVATKAGIRGLDRARILLGCIQPGQVSSTYSDSLNRLADRLHYLNSSDDKAKDATRFWFDTRANLRREMEDRKRRFNDKNEVRSKLFDILSKECGSVKSFFDGVHVMTQDGDVPDDSALRFVVLSPEHYFSKEESRPAFRAVDDYLSKNGKKPRYRCNRLIFLAADHSSLGRLRDCIRVVLAWESIIEDVNSGRLNIDQLQRKQADKQLRLAEEVLPQVVRECYKWLLCPVKDEPGDPEPTIEAFKLNTSGSKFGKEVENVCRENELVITVWSPIHLRSKLKELYWKDDQKTAKGMVFWEDSMRYLYLPRLKDKSVLEEAIVKGASSKDFFGTAYGEYEGKFDGFKFGDTDVQLDDTLILIEPNTAREYENSILKESIEPSIVEPESGDVSHGTNEGLAETPKSAIKEADKTATAGQSRFIGSVEVNATTAKMRLAEIADEVISVLMSDAHADVKVALEITADFSDGVSSQIKRAVSKNADHLDFRLNHWE